MTEKNITIRLMGENDLWDFPDAIKEYEENSTKGDYLFFVIENEDKKAIGYLIAKTKDYKVFIQQLQLPSTLEQEEVYRNTVISNLYHYVIQIKNFEGKKILFQVFRQNDFRKPV